MKTLGLATLGLLLAGNAFAASGRTTDNTYKTMREAAHATGAYLLNKSQIITKAHGILGKSDVKIASGSLKYKGKVRQMMVESPAGFAGRPTGLVQVKVLKVKNGYKGYTDTAANVILPR